MIKLPNNFIFVPLPEGATNVRLRPGGILRWYDQHGFTAKKILPPGKFSIVCMKGEETEDIARGIVETTHIEMAPSPGNDWQGDWSTGFVDYENRGEFPGEDHAGWQGSAGSFRKPLQSLASLYKSLDIYDKIGVILKKA